MGIYIYIHIYTFSFFVIKNLLFIYFSAGMIASGMYITRILTKK